MIFAKMIIAVLLLANCILVYGAPPPWSSKKGSTEEEKSSGINVQIKECLAQAKKSDPTKRSDGVSNAMALLSVPQNRNELITGFISAGCLPIFINCLEDNNSLKVKKDATWLLATISCGTREQKNALVAAGALPVLIKLLSSADEKICENGIIAINNLSIAFAPMVVANGAVPRLISLLESPNEKIRHVTVATFNMLIKFMPEFDTSIFDAKHIQIMNVSLFFFYIENGGAKTFCNLLKKGDAQLTNNILKEMKNVLLKNEPQRNKLIKELDECDGFELIEQLQTPESEQVLRLLIKRHVLKSNEELLKNVEAKFGKELLSTIVGTTEIKLADIEGNENAKETLEKCVVLPALNPALFTGLRAPSKGVLLFGPPGNGKTMLAKAVANECQVTFFSISAASLLSRWYGESERSIKALFQMARNAQPSIIFIDEIDSILRQRSSREDETMRRVKTEFLTQMDGCSATAKSDDQVLVLAATNRPQDLDEAGLRRFPQRIFVDLPNRKSRDQMIRKTFSKNETKLCLSDVELNEIVNKTEHYSYSDLWALCKEAAYYPVHDARDKDRFLRKTTADSLRPVNAVDFEGAMESVKASSNTENRKELQEFAKKFAKQ